MWGARDPSGELELAQRVAELLVADAEQPPEILLSIGVVGGERGEDAFDQGGFGRGWVAIAQLESDGPRVSDEGEFEWRGGGSKSVLGAQEELVSPSEEVEIGITPGVEVGAAAQRLAGLGGRVLTGVVDEGKGEMEVSGELTQSGENGGDLGGVVFVDSLKPDVGVEHEKHRPVPLKGELKPLEMFGAVDPQGGFEDESHVERGEVGSTGASQVLEALADLLGSVLGGIDQHRAGLRDGEATQAGAS